MSVKATIYELASGLGRRTVICDDELLLAQAQAGEGIWLGEFDIATQRVAEGGLALEEFPALPFVAEVTEISADGTDAAIISGLPSDRVVFYAISEESGRTGFGVVEDGNIEITTTTHGTLALVLRAPGYLVAEIQIHAT